MSGNAPRKKPSGTVANKPGAKPVKASPKETRGVKKLLRYKPGIIFQHMVQSNTGPVLGATPFFRVVREIAEELWPEEAYQWQSVAVEALQEAAEIYLICNCEFANIVATHEKRVTILPKDMQRARRLLARIDPADCPDET